MHIVRLSVDGDYPFHAGQYTTVRHPNGTLIPFSIASAPERLPEMEIHFQPLPGAPEAVLMHALLTDGQALTLEPAAGDVVLAGDEPSVLFVCGGSGIAQAWGMMAGHPAMNFQVLWCVPDAEQLYLEAALQAVEGLDPVIVVDPRREAGNAGLVWLRQHAARYANGKIVLCGGPEFVWAAVDALEGVGSNWQLASDVFSYAPRG